MLQLNPALMDLKGPTSIGGLTSIGRPTSIGGFPLLLTKKFKEINMKGPSFQIQDKWISITLRSAIAGLTCICLFTHKSVVLKQKL